MYYLCRVITQLLPGECRINVKKNIKIMRKIFKSCVVALVAILASVGVSYAQPAMRMYPAGQMGPGGHNQWQMRMNQRVTADNGVEYTGVVLSAEGETPLAGVQVMAFAPKVGYIYVTKTGKDGKFKMLMYPGTQYVVEFTSVGYKKFAAVCDAKNEPIEGQPVKLEATVDGIAQMKGKQPLLVNDFRSLQITMSKHPANEGRPLTDLLSELPGLEISPEAFLVLVNPRTEIRINNQLLKVRPQALYSYLSNMEAKALRMIRVTWADVEQEEAAQVYITVDE